MRRLPVFLISFILLTGAGLAQEDLEEDEEDIETTEIELSIDEVVDIKESRFDGSTAVITFKSDIPRIATLTDVYSAPRSGAGTINTEQIRLSSGETTVRFETTAQRGDRLVFIATGDRVASVSNDREPLLTDIDTSTVYIGVGAGIASTFALVMGLYWYKNKKYLDGFVEVA